MKSFSVRSGSVRKFISDKISNGENMDKKVCFRCRCCGAYVKMNRNIPRGFVGWAYDNAEWSDLDENVPEPNENIWERSETAPKVGERRSVKVTSPFDENIGDCFFMEYEPWQIFVNGRDDAPDRIGEGMIVRCRLEKVLKRDEYSAWVRVCVTDAVGMSELAEKYSPAAADRSFEEYSCFDKCMDGNTVLKNNCWECISKNIQGDIGEEELIFTDKNNLRHTVLLNFYAIHESAAYFGNIIE